MVFVLQKQLVYYLLKFLQSYMEENLNLITWRLTHQLCHASKQPYIVRNKGFKNCQKASLCFEECEFKGIHKNANWKNSRLILCSLSKEAL